MPPIDFSAPADFYPSRAHLKRRTALRYRRFDTVAEAVRFAMEDLPRDQLGGTLIEMDEERFEAAAIASLYRSPDFPLPRALA